MRIGLISYEYPPQKGLGGVGTYTFRLAGALAKAGHEVIVLAGPSEGPDIHQAGVKVHRLAARYDPPCKYRCLRILYWRALAPLMEGANPLVWHWLRWDLASGAALLNIHASTPLDVIEAPEHAANGLVIGLMNRWPSVVRTHGPWDLFFGINRTEGQALNWLLARLERKSAGCANVLTAPSRTMARFMQKRWYLPDEPLNVPNFMDVPAEAPPLPSHRQAQRQAPRIVCAGRIERFKGQDVLVQAFARIARRHPRARLVLVGPDQWSRTQRFSQLLAELVPEPELRARIDMLGPLPLKRTQEQLRLATVAVVPSSGFESFSFSTLEAMAAGRPTIVTRTGAMPELLDYGRCGRIVTPGNVNEMAMELDRLLEDGVLREKLAAAAHERALSEYDTRAALPTFIEAYQRARQVFRGARSRRRTIHEDPGIDMGHLPALGAA